jgi:hypothetical protein
MKSGSALSHAYTMWSLATALRRWSEIEVLLVVQLRQEPALWPHRRTRWKCGAEDMMIKTRSKCCTCSFEAATNVKRFLARRYAFLLSSTD